VAAGAGEGIAGQTPTSNPLSATRQISRILTATRRAGTARFSYSSVSTSTNPLLASSTVGNGEVDFALGSMRTVERDRNTELSGAGGASSKAVAQDTVMDDIWIGRTEYTRLGPVLAVTGSPWLKEITWPKGSFGALGALEQLGPLGDLSLDESVPGLHLESAGSATVHGVATHAFLVVLPTCAATRPRDGISESMGPVELWVDGHDRLVKARMSVTEDITKHAHLGDLAGAQEFPTGRGTDVSTVDLGDFGAPVTVAAPPVAHTPVSGGGAFLEMKRAHCP
jgi:hypothetical protein